MRRRYQLHAAPLELNVIPLIDVVFFLLVFYVISTAFTPESAVSIERPASSQAVADPQPYVPIAVTRDGQVIVGTRSVAEAELSVVISAELARVGTTRVVVAADRSLPTGDLLRVMDGCAAGGAVPVDVAASSTSNPTGAP